MVRLKKVNGMSFEGLQAGGQQTVRLSVEESQGDVYGDGTL